MSPRRRRGVAAAALLCVGVLVGIVAVTRDEAGTQPDGATAQAAPATAPTSAPAITPAAPTRSTTAPAPSTRPSTAAAPTPSAPKAATPAPWPPAPVGLTGPVSDVLADAPAKGPVRIVTVARDAQGGPRITVTTARNRSSAPALVRQARMTPGALVVSVDHKVRVADVGQPAPVTSAGITRATPVRAADSAAPSNDTYRGIQWALDTLHAETAWNLHQAIGQVVAVVDTGVDYNHPDLAANIWSNPEGLGGCSGGSHGINTVGTGPPTCDPMDDDLQYGGHGTHVAGILGARGDNDAGVAGVNWSITMLPVKFVDSQGQGKTSDLLEGLQWLLDVKQAGVDLRIVNDSQTFVGTPFSQAAADMIDLLGANDILFVTAAGNSGDDNDDPAVRRYPCGYGRANEICVTATNNRDQLPGFANYGDETVDLGAPGSNIYSTLRDASPWCVTR